jgi:c(7)-type cytochrome triheme protein
LGLVVACAQQPVDSSGAGGNAAATDGPAVAAAPGTAAPVDAAPKDLPEDLTAQQQDPTVAPIGAGLEAAPNVRPDPELSIDAQPPGQATARWGSSGPDVGGKSPWRSLAYDGIHEREGDAIGVLQEPRSALRGLPRARSGYFIDWAAALNDGVIRPRARVGGQGRMEVLDLDILLVDTKNMPVVTFPHRTHTEWLSCKNCHDWLFKAQRGANDISMSNIARGRDCGLCHGKVSFPATDCFRCHNGPRPKG